jgi:hypothetical protein
MMAWILAWMPPWTGWAILIALAFYDIAAVHRRGTLAACHHSHYYSLWARMYPCLAAGALPGRPT